MPKAAQQKIIYLDYHATTPCDSRVVEAMMPYLQEDFGNPHSKDHAYGWQAQEAVETARRKIAKLIGAKAHEVIFTSGATEADNMAIKGAAIRKRKEGRNRLITLNAEHKAVLSCMEYMKIQGFEITILPIEASGKMDMKLFQKAMGSDVALVSVMGVNNEIGTIYPLKEMAAIAHKSGAWFHSDCAQAFGKTPLSVDEMAIDLMSLSSHKAYGPKGIGALYYRSKPSLSGGMPVTLDPLFHGGGQERGIRPGTVPPMLAVGFGKAAQLCADEMAEEETRIRALKFRLYQLLQQGIGNRLSLNGAMEDRVAGNLNVNLEGIEAEQLLALCPFLAISTGSACTTALGGASHVLKAIGIDPAKVQASMRFSVGRLTTNEEIEAAAHMVIAAMKQAHG